MSKRDAPHLPVLYHQVLEALNPRPGQTIVDCTLGLGGHSAAIVERIRPDGRLIGMDLDPANLRLARAALEKAKGRSAVRLDLFHTNYAAIASVIEQAGVEGGKVDAVLADIGVASTQIDDPARGFSYRRPGPLDMRMDPTRGEPARALLARLTARELEEALVEYGDEEDARAIARLVVERRKIKPIETTEQLMAIVCEARDFTIERAAGAKLHPAARTFQALRIMVNRELESLDVLLGALATVLRPGGVGAIISFHSGEDRRVKRAFMSGFRAGVYSQETRDPIVATEKEIRFNPRARSAKLRWVMRRGEDEPQRLGDEHREDGLNAAQQGHGEERRERS